MENIKHLRGAEREAARTTSIWASCADMAADKAIHDQQAAELFSEALGGSEWLLEINDDDGAL